MKWIYVIFILFIHVAEKDENPTEDNAGEEDDEESRPSPELQGAVVECLGKSWPDNPETQGKVIVELVKLLSGLFEATTRANQLTIITCLKRVMAKHQPGSNCQVLPEVGKLLAAALVVPKHSQLRSAGLEVLADLKLNDFDGQDVSDFKDEIAKSLDSVIKDLGTEALSKDRARALRKDIFGDHQ